jgi:hypothetical protein
LGQATAEELLELEEHARDCGACQKAYADYLNVAAQEFALSNPQSALSPHEAEECLDSESFSRRFFARAEREGIVFSPAIESELKPGAAVFSRARRTWFRPHDWRAAAAILIIAALGTGAYIHHKRSREDATSSSIKRSETTSPALSVPEGQEQSATLATANARLQSELEQARIQLSAKTEQLAGAVRDRDTNLEERKRLSDEQAALESQVGELQARLAESDTEVAAARSEANRLRDRSNDLEATLASDDARMHILQEDLDARSAASEKDHELLAATKDVTQLMSARNLHIVDVVDTDARGKTRPAFGRIFFTEGKSLIFYAYDLNDVHAEKANYEYKIWAKKEGPDKKVMSLGMFYVDDKAQRRWAFKCEDPNILNEIDSVFVTLERPNSDSSQPRGQNLMYAYLRGQPNHP